MILTTISGIYPGFDMIGSITILDQQIDIINYEAGGLPVIFASELGFGANDDFLKMPVWAQEALVAHEMGHVYYGHIYVDPEYERDFYYSEWDTVDPREVEADFYAVDIVSEPVYIEMLHYANNICMKIGNLFCVVETNYRIRTITYKICI